MRYSSWLVILAVWFFAGAVVAEAADPKPYQYVVDMTAAPPTCSWPKNPAGHLEPSGEPVPADKDLLQFEIKLTTGYEIREAYLEKKPSNQVIKHYQVSGAAAVGGNPVVKFTRKDFGEATAADSAQLKLRVEPAGGGTSKEIACLEPIAYFAPAESDADNDNATVERDGEALRLWLEGGPELIEGLLKKQKKLGVKDEPQYLVHLPSGKLAYPIEYGVSEAKLLQVAFLLPEGEMRLPGMRLTSCPSVDPFRTKISKVNDDVKQNATANTSSKFELVPIGQMLRCGEGKLSYSVEPIPAYADKRSNQAGKTNAAAPNKGKTAEDSDGAAPSPNDFEFRVRPRYHLAATAMLGYDTATTRKFEKVTDRDETGTERQLIGEVMDRQGLAVYVGAVWMIGGVDYEDMSFWDGVLNLFVGVNPTAPTEDVVAGLALTPTGSVSLALGLSVHKGQRLRSGFTVGSEFTGEGDIPVESTWKGVRPGFFAGLAIDSSIYGKLLDRF